ncbi:MAG: LysM peptidoglycan-binding domain-containing protein [Patulibacter sp.]
MPTLDQAYADLQLILGSAGTIDLATAPQGHPSLADLVATLVLFGAPASLPVTGAGLTRTRDQGVLTGQAQVVLAGTGSPATPVTVRLTLTEPDPNVVVFTLALTIPRTDWKFSDTFSKLPQTARVAPGSPERIWGDSALAGLRVGTPTFTATSVPSVALRMSGALQASGELDDYADWVGPWPLQLDGTASLPATDADHPLLALTATSPQGTLGAPPVQLRRPGFSLIAATVPTRGGVPSFSYSEIGLLGTAEVGSTDPIAATVSGTLLGSDQVWPLSVRFGGQGPSLLGGLGQLASLFGIDAGDLVTPPKLGGFETFRLDDVQIWVTNDGAGKPTGFESIAATIRSDKVWKPPIPVLEVTNVGTRWVLVQTEIDDKPFHGLTGSVFGSLVFKNGGTQKDGIVDLDALLPGFVVIGALREDTPINLGAAFRQLLHRSGPLPDPAKSDPTITELNLVADPFGRTFDASGAISIDVPVPGFASLSVTEVSFQVSATATALSGGLGGVLRLGPAGSPQLAVRAELPPGDQGGWVFSGHLVPGTPLTLGTLLKLIHLDTGDTLDLLAVSRLEGRVSTLGPWSFAGAIAVAFRTEILGVPVALAAGMELELAQATKDPPATGWVEGHFTVNRLRVSARRDLGVAEPTYALKVQFDQLWIQASTAWRGKDPEPRHQIVVLRLGGATLGDVLEELVRLAAPTLGFTLDPPWDVLKRIELSSFSLTIDPKERSVELDYAVDKGIPFMHLDSVGVRYVMDQGSGVELIVKGQLLDRHYGDDNPLTWDVVKDPPPAIPGKGPKLLEVKYLGLGQRVRLPDPQPETVADAISRLAEAMPAPAPGTNPMAKSAMQFDGSSEWLIAADLRFLETVQLALVFNDPRLYGLFVALDGEKAGPLAGLRFEILYKRLPSGVGMFRIELRVPEKFRRIELGYVSIGLGTIVVEIYTNGNFLVDLGFPHGRDFTKSFDVQVFPFIGRGGIYFGVLNGETSRNVPAISNGTFSPVLELGIGLAVGVGKEVSAGPLSGGAYVELEAIFEGVLAWFHPQADGHSTSLFHRVQALVAIHGKVYATADFVVVKASVTLEAYAQATAVFESGRATRFALEVHIEAEAEIEILFVTISFSFEVTLDLSFTVGADEPTPWTISAAQPPRLAARTDPRRTVALQHRRAVASIAAAANDDGDVTWTWADDFVAFTTPKRIDASILPAFSVQHPTVSWTATPGHPPTTPEWRVALPLFIANGIPPTALTPETAVSPPYDPSAPVAAATLVEALLRWALSGLPTSMGAAGAITAGELALVADELQKDYVARTQFTRDRIGRFLGTNVRLSISGDHAQPTSSGAMAFPAPPWLTLATDPGTTRDLFTFGPVGPDYAAGVSTYMARFAPVAPVVDGDPQPDVPADYQSYAAHVFADWCLMIAREAVRQSRASLENAPVKMTAGPDGVVTLDATARSLPTEVVNHTVVPGDSVASVADALGAGVAEIEFWNPTIVADLASAAAGQVLAVTVGVAGSTLAVDNAGLAVAAATVTLTNVRIQVRAGDSLVTIASRLAPADPAQLVADGQLAGDTRLLRAAAPLTLDATANPLTGTLAVDLVAATMYVRYATPTDVPQAEWYVQTIAEPPTNDAVLKRLGPGDPLPVGGTLRVPPSFGAAATQDYVIQTGDTLLRIGTALALAQAPTAYASPRWTAFRAAVVAGGGATIPGATLAILPGEALQDLAARLALSGGVTALLPLVQAQPLLDPFAVITLGTLALGSDRHPTLADMASTAGLTVDELARRPEVGALPGLFAQDTVLTVRHQLAQTIDGLVAAVCGGRPLAEISTQASRTLLGGMRLPAPVADADGHVQATGSLTGTLELTGQQVAAPPLDGPGLTIGVDVTTSDVTVPPTSLDWISFAATPGGPKIAAPLTFSYTAPELAELYPATSLTRVPDRGPEAIPVSGRVPRTYGLEQRIDLQVAGTLAIPGTVAAQPGGLATLWTFPSALRGNARSGVMTPYDVLRAGAHGEHVADHTPLADTTFATLVPLTIRRVAGHEHVYALVGTDADDAELLRELAAAMVGETPAARTQLSLAIAPAPGSAAQPTGVTVFAADPSTTFLIRTDMATDLRLAAPPATVSASLGDGAPFVKLLWEATLAAGGFHFGFATSDGQDLPVGAFDDDGTARLWLLAIRPDGQRPAATGRTLHATDTCVLVAPGLDASAHALYAEAHGIEQDPDRYPDELVTTALVPAGSAGITLTVDRAPLPSGDVAAQATARLAQLFSLLVVGIEGPTYQTEMAAPPAPPQRQTADHAPAWVRRRRLRAATAVPPSSRLTTDPAPAQLWRYDQVLPLYRYANDHDAGAASPMPAVPGLPRPEQDPYRGFGAAAKLGTATFSFGYADVLGNVTQPPAEPETVDVQTGYTDPLLGPATWPAAATSYGVTSADGTATLTVTVHAQPSNVVAGRLDAPNVVAAATQGQADRYAEVVLQLVQPTVTGVLRTSLHPGGDVELVEGTAPLWRFAAASHLTASAAATLRQPALTGPTTLAEIGARYGVPLGALGAANANTPFQRIAAPGQPVTVTARVPTILGDSAVTLLARVPADWPKPTPVDLLQQAENAALPLTLGTVLKTKDTPLPLGDGAPQDTLAAVAGDHHTTAAQLAIDSHDLAVLAVGFVFRAGNQTVTVDGIAIKSFDDVQGAFRDLAVDVALSELADSAADRTELFAVGATLQRAHLVVRKDPVTGKLDTLASIAGPDLATVAAAAVGQVDLWAAGTQITLGAFSPAPTVPGAVPETLGAFAARHGSTAAGLLAQNGALTLAVPQPADPVIVLPGTAVLPAPLPDGIRVPYAIAAADTLTVLGRLFATTPAAIAADNAAMPGILVPERPVSVTAGGVPARTTTADGDTLDAVTARLRLQAPAVDLALVAGAIADDATILAAASLLVMPVPALTARSGGSAPLTPADVTAAYGADAVAFAQVNAALSGLLVHPAVLSAPTGEQQPTTPADTLNGVLNRFAAAGVEVDLPGLLDANAHVALFAAGARALLPPAPVSVSGSIGDDTVLFPQPVFPLSVVLHLERLEDVVLIKDDTVRYADTLVPAPLAPSGSATPSETFAAFVRDFQAALPRLVLGTARVAGETADLWALDVSAHGVGTVTVAPTVTYRTGGPASPRFLALRPLYPALQSRTGIGVPELDANGGITDVVTRIDVQGIDVEVWARQLLADVDLFLSAPYAARMRTNPASRAALDRLLDAKWALCGSVARGLAPVLVPAAADPGADGGRDSAVAELTRACGSSLAAAYDVLTVIQYDATSDAAYTDPTRGLRPARLIGAAQRPTDPSTDLTLTTAATDLAASHSYVGFAMTMPDPAHHASVDTGPLQYTYDGVEFAIDATTDVDDGYESADWLHLIDPLAGSALGAPTVPVPLRTHPPVPLLLDQTATATVAGAPTLAQAAQWTFGVSYSHEHASQDDVLLAVSFNVRRAATLQRTVTLDLAESLARYATLGDTLRSLMTVYLDPSDPRQGVRDAVATTVATIVGDVATAWDGHWPTHAPAVPVTAQQDVPEGDTHHFRIDVDYDAAGTAMTAVTLTLDGTTTTPGPNGWPTVHVRGPDGMMIALTGTAAGPTAQTYTPAAPVAVSAWPTLRIEWPGLNVASVGSGRVSLAARRNAHLLDGVPTNGAFVLGSASITAPEVATPLLEWPDQVLLSGATLEDALTAALSTLFGSVTGPPVTIALSYGHELVPDSGLDSYLPVALYPDRPLDAAIATAVGGAATTWQRLHRPATEGGKWVVSLTLSSWLEPASSRPLLVLGRLVLPLGDASGEARPS